MTAPAFAEVADVTITDVTTRAFSVVWVSDQALSEGTTVRVFSDADGNEEISSDLEIALISEQFELAMTQGIAKVDVTGLAANTLYYVQTVTVGPGGTVDFPAAGAEPLELRTATTTRKGDDAGVPIVNDVIFHEIFDPDGATPGDGTLLMVKVPSLSAYPLTGFVGRKADTLDGFEAPTAAVDMNNFFDDVTGESAQVPAGAVIEISEYRGLLCAGLANHRLNKLRRVPTQGDDPQITELRVAAECFAPDGVSADFNCDGRIGVADFARFLANFQLEAPDCQFNGDFDLSSDGRIGVADFARFLSVFGNEEQAAP